MDYKLEVQRVSRQLKQLKAREQELQLRGSLSAQVKKLIADQQSALDDRLVELTAALEEERANTIVSRRRF